MKNRRDKDRLQAALVAAFAIAAFSLHGATTPRSSLARTMSLTAAASACTSRM